MQKYRILQEMLIDIPTAKAVNLMLITIQFPKQIWKDGKKLN